jgi:hypothetical protein
MRRAPLPFIALVLVAPPASGQAVPEGSQAARVEPAYRRTPTFRFDPFRHATIPHWGFVISTGVLTENNSLNLTDLGAIISLGCGPTSLLLNPTDVFGGGEMCPGPDNLLPSDILNAINLVPQGRGLTALAQGEGGLYLGGPFGGHFGLGLSAQGRGYGAFQLDEDFVSLVRDGTSAQNFSLGSSKGAALATAEGGAHAVIRLGPLGTEDGVHVNFGFGGRYIRPLYFGRAGSTVGSGDLIRITSDSIIVDAEVEVAQTPTVDSTLNGKAAIAADFLLRLTWPTSGFALEAMVANLGNVTIHHVEVETRRLRVRTNDIAELSDSLNSFDSLAVTDTTDVRITLPRVVRFTASAWANRILQVDVSAALPVKGDFEAPLGVDIGTTWRFIRVIPLRAGVVLGGHQGIGFTGGLAIEGRTGFFQLAGQSFGGFMRKATGVGGRFEMGFFF